VEAGTRRQCIKGKSNQEPRGEENMRKVCMISLIATVAAFFIGSGIVKPPAAHGGLRFVTIGTGEVTGIYYLTGGAIGRIVNKKSKQYNLKVTVESTGGSAFNVNAVMTGDLEFGVVQSDRQYQAINALAEWKEKGAQKDLRAICAFHPRAITLVAGDDTGIMSVKDLRGKRVNIGNPGSGQRQNSIDILNYFGIDCEKDMQAEGVKAVEAPKFLQDGRIDAFFYTVGHPNANIKEATSGRRKVHIIPITGIEEMFKKFPYYAPVVIPMKHYPTATNKEKEVPSFGVKATFVTSIKVPEDIVYAITKEVFDNLEDFKKLHPAFEVLTKKNMMEGLSAPLHPGALKYFKEAGLM
jgi:TRAP transporter TAXI family solute receptor